MERLACVRFPLLALQATLKAHPEWRNFPAVLLDRLHPRGVVLQANKHARRMRIGAGMRYAAALSLCQDLRAEVLDLQLLAQTRAQLEAQLRLFSPNLDTPADLPDISFFQVDHAPDRPTKDTKTSANQREKPDLFWLQAAGLDRYYGSFHTWTDAILASLKELEFHAAIVVGFSRFATAALADALGTGALILPSATQEALQVRALPLAQLTLTDTLKHNLTQFGIDTVGAFLDLPAAGLERRFGREARHFYDFASEKDRVPIKNYAPEAAIERTIVFEAGLPDNERLLFQLKYELHEMATALAARGLVFAALTMTFCLRADTEITTDIRPARPGLDEAMLMELVRLRLDSLELQAPPTRLHLHAEGIHARSEPVRLLSAAHDRRWDQAQHALARLRAEFGPRAVLQLQPHEAHLPEASFSLKPLEYLTRPRPTAALSPTWFGTPRPTARGQPLTDFPPSLVRRLLRDPAPLGAVLPSALEPSLAHQYPYVLSGGWWENAEIHRAYYYAEARAGDILWIFYDYLRRAWFVHGRVE